MLIVNEVLTDNEADSIEGDDKLIRKYRKLSKIGKLLESLKLSKSQKSTKLKKKLSKSRKLSNFDAKKNEPSFLISDVKITFNCL